MIEADVARIAAGLTKAQRAAILSAKPHGKWVATDEPCSFQIQRGTTPTRRALAAKGLAEMWGYCSATLTEPLGLAVKAHLANAGNMVPVDGGEGAEHA